MFDFKNVSEGRKFVGYGINHDVTIVGVESGESTNGTPYIQVKFKNTGDTDDNSTISKMYLTAKSTPITQRKIMHIHSAVGKIEQLKSKSFDTLEAMAAGLNSLWAGRRLRLKLQAGEYMGVDADGASKVKVRTEVPMSEFAEAIEKGAEMFPIADADTQLKFDKNDKWDYKRIDPPTPSMGSEETSTDTGKSDLPF